MLKADRTSQTKLILLGTGTPNADPQRSGPAVLIVCHGQAYLVDFGPGVVRRAAAAFLAHAPELDVSRIKHVFCTHLHSDHTAGYADLILTPAVLGRSQPLQVYGPTGIKKMTDLLLQAYAEDIRERLEGLEPTDPAAYQVQALEIKAGVVYQDSNLKVEAFEMRHGSWPAYAYRFSTPEGSIVISGDTAPHESMAEIYRGCDILLHEVYSGKGFAKHSPEWQNYHSQMHTSAEELGKLASQAEPGLLVLYHQLFWGVDEEELLAEMQCFYQGRVICGEDLDVFCL